MNTREQLQALNEELCRLKSEGRRTVSVSEESVAMLRAALADEPDEASAAPAANFSIAEEPVRAVYRPAPIVAGGADPGPAST
ncbi:MAG: hypothetical protein ABUL61_04930, partial [Oleiharenicola lentus]